MRSDTLRIALIAVLAVSVVHLVLPRIPGVGPHLSAYVG